MFTFTETNFGDMLNLDVPEDCSAIILCIDGPHIREPVSILLPHQIYREELIKIFKDRSIQSVSIIPILKSQKAITINRNDI